MKKKHDKIFELEVLDILIYNYPDLIDIAYNQYGVLDIQAIKRYAIDEGAETSYLFFYAALAWREHKQIFEFDEEMCQELMETDSLDDDIPVQAMIDLPFPCFYVRLPEKFINLRYIRTSSDYRNDYNWVHGFYYYVLNNVGTFVLILNDRATVSLGCDLSDPTKSVRSAFWEYTKPRNEDSYKMCNFIMQLVLYLCTINGDIQENVEQKKIYRKPRDHSQIKDRYTEIRKWDVGYRYGAKVRKNRRVYEVSSEKTEQGHGSPKRPHSRRGHYHHYWTGSKSDPNQRNLILKWIAPMLINGKSESENYENEAITAVIHKT